MKNEFVEEKTNTGAIVLVVILSLLVVGLGGYVVYDKFFSENEIENKESSNQNNITELSREMEAKYLELINIYSPKIFDSKYADIYKMQVGQEYAIDGEYQLFIAANNLERKPVSSNILDDFASIVYGDDVNKDILDFILSSPDVFGYFEYNDLNNMVRKLFNTDIDKNVMSFGTVSCAKVYYSSKNNLYYYAGNCQDGQLSVAKNAHEVLIRENNVVVVEDVKISYVHDSVDGGGQTQTDESVKLEYTFNDNNGNPYLISIKRIG